MSSNSNLFVVIGKKNKLITISHDCSLKNDNCGMYLLNIQSENLNFMKYLPINIYIDSLDKKNLFSTGVGIENWQLNNTLTDQVQFGCLTNTSPCIPQQLYLKHIRKLEIENKDLDLLVLQFRSRCTLSCFTT